MKKCEITLENYLQTEYPNNYKSILDNSFIGSVAIKQEHKEIVLQALANYELKKENYSIHTNIYGEWGSEEFKKSFPGIKEGHPLVFLTLENGTKTLRQHIFKPEICTNKFTAEKYMGNISLCGNIAVSDDDELRERFASIINLNEPQSLNCCKGCLKVYEAKK